MPIRGARENNLQNIDVTIPDRLTGISGVSESGKTSLAFDTLYHEARRLVDVYSLGSSQLRLNPADVHGIEGLGAAVAVGRNLLNRNPNSTLPTASGLHPLLRLAYARYGERRCARCADGQLVLAGVTLLAVALLVWGFVGSVPLLPVVLAPMLWRPAR